MKITRLYFLLLFALLPFIFLSSCEDDSGSTPIVGNIVPPTNQSFVNLKATALNNRVQSFSLALNDLGMVEFTSLQGVNVSIYTGCLTIEGEPVEGEVEVQFVELYNRSNLLTTNIATMGRHFNGDLEMLVTGGAFYLNVLQNGMPVDSSCGFSLQVPSSLTGGIDEEMILWYGEINEKGDLVWEEANGEEGQGGELWWQDNDAYYVWTSQFGWTNIDRFYNDPRPKTTIYVDIPQGYNYSNCAVYLSYDGEENALARLDTYDEETGLFSEHYGYIPIGLECHLIFVSEHNGQWVYAIKPITIVENEIIEILYSDLSSVSETGLTNLISSLP